MEIELMFTLIPKKKKVKLMFTKIHNVSSLIRKKNVVIEWWRKSWSKLASHEKRLVNYFIL